MRTEINQCPVRSCVSPDNRVEWLPLRNVRRRILTSQGRPKDINFDAPPLLDSNGGCRTRNGTFEAKIGHLVRF